MKMILPLALGAALALVPAVSSAIAADNKPTSKPAAAVKAKIKPGIISEADFKDLVKQIEAAAKSYLEDGNEDYDLEEVLQGVWYDESNIDLLAAALKAQKTAKDPENLFIINKLLTPLLPDKSSKKGPKTEVYAKILPAVADLKPLVKFVEFPAVPPGKIAALQLPETPKGNEAAAMAKLDAVQKARAQKLKEELPKSLHNLQAVILQGNICRVMIACQDPKEDRAVIDIMTDYEKAKLAVWSTVLNAIHQEIPRMSQEQAKRFYDELLRLGEQNKLARVAYRDPSNCPVNPIGATEWLPMAADTGTKFMEIVNAAAPIAKLPAVKVLDYDGVSAGIEAKKAEEAAKAKNPGGK